MAYVPEDFRIGLLFDLVADAVIVCNVEDGRIELWSPAARRIFGYTAAEAVGKNVTMLIPERLRTAHTDGREHYRATGEGFYANAHVPIALQAIDRSGKEFTMEMTISRVIDAKVEGAFCVAVIRDSRGRWDLSGRRRDGAAKLTGEP